MVLVLIWSSVLSHSHEGSFSSSSDDSQQRQRSFGRHRTGAKFMGVIGIMYIPHAILLHPQGEVIWGAPGPPLGVEVPQME